MAKEKGFTLIEVMIVLAIAGILAAIAIPNYVSYNRKQALEGRKQAEIRELIESGGTYNTYKAIRSSNIDSFNKEINNLLRNEWKLDGKMIVIQQPNKPVEYVQKLTRE